MTGRVRWGLVGAGDIAERRVAPALRDAPGSELVALARRRPELAADFAARFGIRRVHAGWEELVRDPEIDAVYVATPVDLHAPVSIAAARAGKHVLCEKPMALTLAECDAMIAAALEGGVKLGVAYYRGFFPLVHRIRALLAGGAVGRPVVVQSNAFAYHAEIPADRAWFFDPARAGGGPMYDFGCHRVELLLHLLGPISEVLGIAANVVFERPVEDTAVGVLRFASGPVATLTVSHAARERRDTFSLFGTEGSLHVESVNAGDLRIVRVDGEAVESHPPPPNQHLPLVQQFVEAVLSGGAPTVDGAAGREVNRILEEIYR